MNIDDFLAHLDRPRKTSRGWTAKCPSHQDRSPSLSIREGDDGRLLVRCFGGCSAAEIVGAMGLSLKDLFPDEGPDRSKLREASRRREAERQADKIESQRMAVFREAEATVGAARGIDSSSLTDEGRDRIIDQLGDAYAIINEEQREERLREIEAAWTNSEMQSALNQLTERGS